MSMGRSIKIDELKFMQSFFPGDSMYMFVNDEHIRDANGPCMLHVDACAYMMTVFARFWFENKEDAKAYIDANYDEHWFEKESREGVAEPIRQEELDDILKDVPVVPPPADPDE